MTKPNDGGPAYPISAGTYTHGMSLRDHFATQALVGIGNWMPPGSSPEPYEPWDLMLLASLRAQWAYRQADAMIAAREQEAPSHE